MTLRIRIAEALRIVARETVVTALEASSLGDDARAGRALVIASLFGRLADKLDPRRDAAAGRADGYADERAAAPSASGGVDRVKAEAAGACDGQGGQRSTAPSFTAHARGRDLRLGINAEDAFRFVKGGSA